MMVAWFSAVTTPAMFATIPLTGCRHHRPSANKVTLRQVWKRDLVSLYVSQDTLLTTVSTNIVMQMLLLSRTVDKGCFERDTIIRLVIQDAVAHPHMMASHFQSRPEINQAPSNEQSDGSARLAD
jgi:hypothetical protein